MPIGVLANAESWYLADIARAAHERGLDCLRIDYRTLLAGAMSTGELQTADGVDLRALQGLIVRTMPPGSLEQVVFRMDVLARLESAGVPVINSPRAIEYAVDKYLATAKVTAAGLPVPETLVCETADEAMRCLEQLGGDVVVKPVFGAEGRGIVRVSDPDIGLRVFRTLERIDAVLYLQRFIPHPGFDLRILVLDGEPLGAMRRYATDGFRTNVACQGRAEVVAATDEEIDLALRATAVIGARIAGIDILQAPDGTRLVVEVNGVPGWQAFQRVTGIDVAGRLLDRVLAGPRPSSLCVANRPSQEDSPCR